MHMSHIEHQKSGAKLQFLNVHFQTYAHYKLVFNQLFFLNSALNLKIAAIELKNIIFFKKSQFFEIINTY